uniref:Uncharacterized protein n=1 Tax=Nelumbo nucifera TaxID=4432 RepID=A0A822ZAG6_NELNU|nr:TPA_asm: hypothetical protein HUJ06_000332 [Nelumbo nucifera]
MRWFYAETEHGPAAKLLFFFSPCSNGTSSRPITGIPPGTFSLVDSHAVCLLSAIWSATLRWFYAETEHGPAEPAAKLLFLFSPCSNGTSGRPITDIPPGTLYGLFSVGYFRLSQIKDAISNSIPKLHRKFADAIILVKSINDTPSVIALETKIPTQGVVNRVDRAAQNRGKKPRSPIPINWKEELLNWASKSLIADRTTPILTQNFNHFPANSEEASREEGLRERLLGSIDFSG